MDEGVLTQLRNEYRQQNPQQDGDNREVGPMGGVVEYGHGREKKMGQLLLMLLRRLMRLQTSSTPSHLT